MHFAILPFLTGVAFILPTLAQLSNEVPPPECLYNCIQTYGDCSLCTTNGTTAIENCISATCDPRGGVSYAEVYYDSICQDNGYIDYDTTPPHYVTIPPNNCTVPAKRWNFRPRRFVIRH